jgi:CDP-diacylglycerol--serine O-phosphatidyltransferase
MNDYLFHLAANIFTFINLSLGLYALQISKEGAYRQGALIIFAAMLFDKLDGTISRKSISPSPIGKELDSLADMISFGSAPALLFFWYSNYPTPYIVFPLFYACCGAFRLARFNLLPPAKNFTGVPIPVGAILLLFPIVFGIPCSPLYFCLLPVITGLLMISRVKFPKLRF